MALGSVAVPATAAVPVPDAPGVSAPSVAAPPSTADDDARDDDETREMLEDEAGSAVKPEAVGLPWLSRTVEQLGLALRARAGLTSTGMMPQSASGELLTVAGAQEAPREARTVRPVRVQVEKGLPVDGEAFADFVLTVLNDERGWGHDGSVVFSRTDGPSDISVVLASPALTDELCRPLRTVGEYSCGRDARAVLNAERWSDGAAPFLDGGGNITEYRQYLVNHEVGHLLGHPHESCPVPGEPAPIMLQQTMRLEGCLPQPWPAG
ncbi:DUF3152 domain-containing protein [Georgenia sp. SUBG003]|uniref:DUF3152 domain-containing protein n=1 Tax=Georgenia sp. SUBG003 TaxID=1497974 RepID=UPI0004D452B5|nr:hypothetical protein DA06_17025 [Georgenia sp. SUBG003]